MSLSDFFRRGTDKPQVANRGAILSRYKHLRHVSRNLNSKLVQRLSKDVLFEGARKLGILKGNTFVFDSEDESSVLMDYCIYDVRRDGRNAFEKYLVSCSPDSESDELTCLRAMQSAIYSLFVVETVERGLGITVQDLRTNEIHLVADLGLASTGRPEMVFASRLLFHDGFTITGGAALPVGLVSADQRDALIKQILAAVKPDDDGYFDPAPLIRSCLSNGASSHVRYLESPEEASRLEQLPQDGSRATIDRYAPCPCGSGKKFKFCCLNRR